MDILTPKGLLIAISSWKVLSYITYLLWNVQSIPTEVNTSVSVVCINVILAYAIYYQIPYNVKMIEVRNAEAGVIHEGLHRITTELNNNLRNIGPDHDSILKNTMLQYKSKMQKMHKAMIEEDEILHTSLNYTSDLADDVGDKSATMITDLLVPTIIILCLIKNYKMTAVVIHIFSEFLQLHFQKIGEQFHLITDFKLRLGFLGYMDILAPLLLLIPHHYIQRLSQFVKRTVVFYMLKRKDSDPQQAFIEACAKGNKSNMKKLLDKFHNHINVNVRTGVAGNTGLHIACQHGHLNIVQSILDCEKKKVKLDLANFHGFTPLALAANFGYKLIIRRLLKCKNLTLSCDEVEKSILVATQQEHYECAKIILTEYRTRKGKDFDSALATYITRVEECMRKNDRKSVDIYKKAIQAWFMARSAVKTEQKGRAKKSKEEIWQNIQDHFECCICYEEFRGGEIYSCENDHWICLACKNSWTINCPTCRADFGENGPLRRHKVEKILVDLAALRGIMEEKPHSA